jgi:hypothetical protein
MCSQINPVGLLALVYALAGLVAAIFYAAYMLDRKEDRDE